MRLQNVVVQNVVVQNYDKLTLLISLSTSKELKLQFVAYLYIIYETLLEWIEYTKIYW